MPQPEVFLAVVQRGDDPTEQETEVVTVTIGPAGLPIIESTDGTRIEAIVRIENAPGKAAA